MTSARREMREVRGRGEGELYEGPQEEEGKRGTQKLGESPVAGFA